MAAGELLNLTIEFLEHSADGLRLVTQANSPVECLISSRSVLPRSLGEEASFRWLDVPGVYLLIGPSEHATDGNLQQENQLYVGQADSVADRLGSHLRSEHKQWWRTAAVFRRAETNPLNLTHCKFLESKLCSLALNAQRCALTNKVGPGLPSLMARGEQNSIEDFLQKALVIVSALGWDFFQQPAPAIASTPVTGEAQPQVPTNLKPLFEQIRNVVAGSSFPRAEWYWTRTPDYRAKVTGDGDLRVFCRSTWAKNWCWGKRK